MASDWQRITVAEVAASSRNALVGGPFGSNLVSKDYVPSGIPVIRGQNMGSRWVGGEFVFVTEAKAKSLEANLARPRDLVFTQRGTLGQVAVVPSHPFEVYLISQSQMKLTVDEKKAQPLFLYYVFTSQEQQEYIRQHSIQTGVPHTNLGILRETPIFVPPIEEQRAIALILGELDDKIELNRRLNDTLEDVARALFKSWFVAFDPVRAKAEARDPGLPRRIADLFPDSFEDSESGEIPRGWQTRLLGDVCERIFSGGTPSTTVTDYWGGELPWLSSGETRARFITSTEKFITEKAVENSSTRFARAGATVVASAGQGNTRGQTSMLMLNAYINQSVVALLADKAKTTDNYLYFDLESRYEEFRRVSDGHSSRGSLTTKLLAGLATVLPPRDVILAFDSAVDPIVQRIGASLRETDFLSGLRNTLLPKLISGELRIRDAERIVGKQI
ncbi:MAG TPA: restriction endonuclease subunit S [Terriglobales bacterium]|jgi:type I restriction enzyme S subunit|nr:restriction endonuclease subunit S [Terriglobales bacterium]